MRTGPESLIRNVLYDFFAAAGFLAAAGFFAADGFFAAAGFFTEDWGASGRQTGAGPELTAKAGAINKVATIKDKNLRIIF